MKMASGSDRASRTSAAQTCVFSSFLDVHTSFSHAASRHVLWDHASALYALYARCLVAFPLHRFASHHNLFCLFAIHSCSRISKQHRAAPCLFDRQVLEIFRHGSAVMTLDWIPADIAGFATVPAVFHLRAAPHMPPLRIFHWILPLRC